MPEYLAPGVYVEEIATGPRPIEGVSTSTTGFVGVTERGPTTPRLVTSFIDYERWFGGYLGDSPYLPHAVRGFFANGGQRLFVARVTPDDALQSSLTLKDAGANDVIVMKTIGPDMPGDRLVVRIAESSRGGDTFRLTILYFRDGISVADFVDPTVSANLANPMRREPEVLEDYDDLSVDDGSPENVFKVVNSASRLVRLEPAAGATLSRPANLRFPMPAAVTLATGVADTNLEVEAGSIGVWADGLEVSVENLAGNNFDLRVVGLDANQADTEITYEGLSIQPTDQEYFAQRVNKDPGPLITVRWEPPNAIPSRPAAAPAAPLVGGGTTTKGELEFATADAGVKFFVTAGSVGGWADDLNVAIIANAIPTDPFDILLTGKDQSSKNTIVKKEFAGLTFDPADPDFALTRVNNHPGALLKLSWSPAFAIPGLPNLVAGAELHTEQDGRFDSPPMPSPITPDDFLGDGLLPVDERTGFAGLATIDEISILAAPQEVDDLIDPTGRITNALIDQCEQLRDRFAVTSILRGEGDVATVRPPRDTSYGAFYYPWIRVFDPPTQSTILVPPTGHAAGIYARTDVERGVHKAPANAVVRGIVTRDVGDDKPLEFTLSKGEHDILNPRSVNVIRDFRTDRRGIRVWGARTMSSDSQWKYINVRRLFLFVEESIDEGTQWVVFEPNHDPTWAAVRRSVGNFLRSVWRSGALMGLTEEEAFFVKCDRTTMTQDDIDNGRLICYIGIAPVKPAEFVIFRISQKTIETES